MTGEGWHDLRLSALLRGEKDAWDAFVERHAGIIYAAIRRAYAGTGRPLADADANDIFQDVFVRLAANDYRLLRNYDPARSALSTFLTVVARSTALNALRRRQMPTATMDAAEDIPDARAGPPPEPLDIPPDLLTARQRLIVAMSFEDDLDVPEIAKRLGIAAQTVRSTQHKALIRLREFFGKKNNSSQGDESP